jgi:histidinol-phosphate aminotransferase
MENQNRPIISENFTKVSEWETLVRPHLLKIKPYSSARDDFSGAADIWLDANELPYGKYLNCYPDPKASELKKIIAKIKKWKTSDFLLGNGSDECIELLIKMFCEPGQDEIMICPPTYGMYKVTALIHNVKVNEVLQNGDFQLQENEILSKATDKTKILFICSPNNPTGNLIDRSSIHRILREFKGIVVIDEAYIDFSGEESWTAEVLNFPRLIVLQTLSKSAGLAGLRIGICFAQEALIQTLYSIKPPYNLSLPAQIISIFELKKHKKHRKLWKKINSFRDDLIQSLSKFDSVEKIYPSDANFLLLRVKDATLCYSFLAENGIVVRNRSSEPLCDNCLRISIGKSSENEQLLKVWKRMDKSLKKKIQSDYQEL